MVRLDTHAKKIPTDGYIPPNAAGSNHTIHDYELTGRHIEVVGNTVVVDASFKLQSVLVDQVHLWRLIATKPTDSKVVSSKFYVEQAFEMDHSGAMTPTFSDRLMLPAGDYRVAVKLYVFPATYNFKQLKNDPDLEGYASVGADQVVHLD